MSRGRGSGSCRLCLCLVGDTVTDHANSWYLCRVETRRICRMPWAHVDAGAGLRRSTASLQQKQWCRGRGRQRQRQKRPELPKPNAESLRTCASPDPTIRRRFVCVECIFCVAISSGVSGGLASKGGLLRSATGGMIPAPERESRVLLVGAEVEHENSECSVSSRCCPCQQPFKGDPRQ